MSIRLSNEREVSRELEALATRSGVVGDTLSDIAAQVGIRALVRNTQPFGLGGKAWKQGRAKTERDVRRCFYTVRPPRRPEITTTAAAAAHHNSQRDRRGRVGRRAIRKSISAAALDAYAAAQVAKVGSAKGGWVAAAARLGVSVQKWIMAHADEGIATRSGRKGARLWNLHARSPHVATPHVLGERGAARSLAQQERNVKKFFEAKLRAEMKKAEKKLNS